MTFEPEEGDFSQVCPYLGLADDADSHATYPTEAHRCYRLPNPTRIATGHQETYCLGEAHVSCPVYQGEGVSRPAPAAAAAAPPPAREPAIAGKTAASAPARGGSATREPRAAAPREQAPAGRPPRQQRRPAPGTLGPRPRAGGISMPVATVGLFAGAIVIALIAAAISSGLFGGDGNEDDGIPTLPSKTATVTQTQQGGGGNGTATQQPGTQTQQAGSATPGTATATRTATGTASAGGDYVVKSGDTCFDIATANKTTLEALLKANNMTEADCDKIQPGDKLKLP